VCWKEMISGIIQDLSNGAEKNMVALKVHCSLAALVAQIARQAGVRKIAFSGGVMQNALLTDLLIDKLKRFDLFFHQQLSPNDECISFGQLAYWQLQVENNWPVQKKKVETLV
jgi:hydrogenase maturation protein HypF